MVHRGLGRRLGGTKMDRFQAIRAKRYIDNLKNSEKIMINLKKM